MRYLVAVFTFVASFFVTTAYAATIYSPTITGYYQATNEAMYSATPYTTGTMTTGYVYGKLSFGVPPGGYMSGSVDLSGLTIGDHITVTYSLGMGAGDSTMESISVISANQTISFSGTNEMSQNVNGVEFYSASGKQFAVNNITINSQIPATPSSLTASSITSSSALVSWGSIVNATSYLVYLDGKKIDTTTGASYTLSGLQGDSTHYVQVASANSAGISSLSNPYTFTTSPNPPIGLNATNTTYDSLTLDWTASNGATSYLVFENGSQIGSSSGTSYNVTGLSGNTSYSFYVEAQGTLISAPSTTYVVTTALPPMPTPTGVTTSGTPGGSGTVSWTPGTGTPTGTTYTISQNGDPIGTTTGTSYTVSPYDPNSTYTVSASAPGYTTSSQNKSLVSGLQTSFGAGDLFTNTALLLWSVGSFLLLSLTFYVAPKFIRLIKKALKSKDQKNRYQQKDVSTRITPSRDFERTIRPYKDFKNDRYTIRRGKDIRSTIEPRNGTEKITNNVSIQTVRSDEISSDVTTGFSKELKTGYDYGFELE